MEQGFSVTNLALQGRKEKLEELSKSLFFRLLLFTLASIACYSHTLDVPFYFDDYTSLRDNPAIRDMGSLWDFTHARIVAYFTFALNYAIHGYDEVGYHLVNILIHVAAGLSVFWLTLQIVSSRCVAPYCSPVLKRWLPLLVALLFVLHPLQTQAVTYIVQRVASLAALFYLLSLASYLRARMSEARRERLVFAGLAGLFALLGFFTKQNTLTLPLAMLLLELCFLRPQRKYLAALFALGAAGALALVLFFQIGLNRSFLEFLSNSTMETDTITRSEYFSVQMQVLWTYIAKFFLPVSLHLDYDLQAPSRFWNLETLTFALGHLALIGGALVLLRRSPVIAFGILFYYSAHLVESSIIPIRDVGFEHRTYLPNFGLCLALAWILLAILPRYLSVKAVSGLAIGIVLGLGSLTWLRNNTWRDPIAFFQHEVEVNPGNFRAHSMLAENYLRLEQVENALLTYDRAAKLFGSLSGKETNAEVAFYSNYILALSDAGKLDEALEVFGRLNLEGMEPADQALFLSRRGIIHAKAGRFELAEADFRAALAANPQNIDALNNYAKVLLITGRVEASRELFERVRRFDPASTDAQLTEYFRNNPAPPAQ